MYKNYLDKMGNINSSEGDKLSIKIFSHFSLQIEDRNIVHGGI